MAMYTDAVVATADSGGKHKLKVDDKIFESKDAISLLSSGQNVIEYRLIGDSLRILSLNLADNPYILKRLQKQFDVAKEKYERVKTAGPSVACHGLRIKMRVRSLAGLVTTTVNWGGTAHELQTSGLGVVAGRRTTLGT